MLQRLVLTAFRNYRHAEFRPGPRINLLVGDNGSGKSSLLEAIYLLGSGRSFRSSRLQRLVREGDQETVLFAEVAGEKGNSHRLGMSRTRQAFSGLKLDGANLKGLSELARLLPVQVFHPGTVEIVEGPSSARRRYLDWGLFHVEQSFLQEWRALNSALQQRNRQLRTGAASREISPWSQQVARGSDRINQLRSGYLEALRPHLASVLSHMGELPEVSLTLYPGWPEGEDLLALLDADLLKDRERGHTTRGAHRAELRMMTSAGPVRDVFSRGQLKTLGYALLLAQLNLLVKDRDGHCLILVDDLASELDQMHSGAVLQALRALNQQMIITALSAEALPGLADDQDVNMFHVEHGVLTP
ncbi:DNA replication/repair protein RecF [Isoalcanivorax indicus]|uniref:DNA replication/repair protein RecF n=1 Tax=Isoalcanivorax indicus TaxID=2202653 RepID=UPI000DB9C60D|nr:DNA replication/repair protein RecF [Isoalcanivorax indicus]